MAHHLGEQASIRTWVELHAPWMTFAELATLIQDVEERPRRWRADKLAWRLRLTRADRDRLGITTIGAIDFSLAERQARRRQRDKLRKELSRRMQGTKPRAQYEAQAVSRAKPWIVAAVSRATWYRRKRETVSTP
jgi:hypothetical protein